MKKFIILSMMITIFSVFQGRVYAIELGGVDVHGFISQGFIFSDSYNYLAHDSKTGSFQYNEVGINFSKELNEKLRLGLQLFSRDLGDVANNKVTLDWAYGDYRWQDWLGFRVGRIKLPINLYNETRDIDMLRTNIIMPQGIYNDFLRDTFIAANGVSVYGNIPVSKAGSLDYQLVAGAVNTDNDSGVKKMYDNFLGGVMTLDGEMDTETSFSGSLRWNTPLDGLALSMHGVTTKGTIPLAMGGASFSVEANFDLTSYGLEYTWENLSLAAEYRLFTSELIGLSKSTSETYYLSAAYRFSELFEAGIYYSVYYPDDEDKNGANEAFASDAWEKDLALSLRFDVNEYITFKIEGHSVDGTANVIGQDNANMTEDKFYYGVTKLSFSF